MCSGELLQEWPERQCIQPPTQQRKRLGKNSVELPPARASQFSSRDPWGHSALLGAGLCPVGRGAASWSPLTGCREHAPFPSVGQLKACPRHAGMPGDQLPLGGLQLSFVLTPIWFADWPLFLLSIPRVTPLPSPATSKPLHLGDSFLVRSLTTAGLLMRNDAQPSVSPRRCARGMTTRHCFCIGGLGDWGTLDTEAGAGETKCAQSHERRRPLGRKAHAAARLSTCHVLRPGGLAYSFLRADLRFSSLSSCAASRSFTSEPGMLAGTMSSWRLLLCAGRQAARLSAVRAGAWGGTR